MVDGMTCESCVRSVTKKLAGVSAVARAVVNLKAGTAIVEYDDSSAKVEDLIAAVEQIGFHAVRS
jgi:copper chaperone CopZ